MRPRPFRLQRLLDVRRLRQRQREQALAAATRKVRQQEAEVERVMGGQAAARDQLRDLLTPGPGTGGPTSRVVPLADVRRYRAYLSALGQEAGRAASLLPALRQGEAARRAELGEARRAAKVLENLRDRWRDARRRWLRRREQKGLDDVANAARARRSPRPSRNQQSGVSARAPAVSVRLKADRRWPTARGGRES